jgi:IS30 family transposase
MNPKYLTCSFEKYLAQNFSVIWFGGTRNSHIATLVERHSCFTILVKVPSKVQDRTCRKMG